MSDRGIAESPLALGTVGWDDDGGTTHDLGDSSNDGSSLVRVQLFRGRDPTKPLDQEAAQGQRLLCRLSTSFVSIPPKGTQVLVGIPSPFGMVPGAAVILTTIGNDFKSLANISDGEVVIPALEGQAKFYLRKNGSLVFKTADAGSNTIFFKIGPDTFFFAAPWGTIEFSGNGAFIKHASGAQLRMGGISGLPGPLSQMSSYAKLKAGVVKVDGTQVLCGPDSPGQQYFPAVYMNDIMMGPSPEPPLAVFSTTMGIYLAAIEALIVAQTPGGPMAITAAQQTAITGAFAAMANALIQLTTGILSSTTVKVAP